MPKQEQESPPSLESLNEAIQAAKKRQQGDTEDNSGRSGAGDAMRIGVELMSGIVVGVLAGYWLDKWLGTSPWFFLACFFLGVAGSGLNIYRMSKRAAARDEENGAEQ